MSITKNKISKFICEHRIALFIVLLGFIFRLWGINFDLPLVSTIGDELPAVSVSAGMVARFSLMPQATLGTDFPLLYYIYLISFLPYLLGLFILKGFSVMAVKQTIALDLSGLLLTARLASLLLSTATIWLIYAISRRLFGSKLPAYFAALFFALDPLNASLGHFARIWGPQIFFIYLSLYVSLYYFGIRDRIVSAKEYFLTAVFVLLSMALSLVGIFAYLLWLITVVVYRLGFDWRKIIRFFFSKQSLIFHAILFAGGLMILFLGHDSLSLYKEAYFVFFTTNPNLTPSDYISFEGDNYIRTILPMWQRIALSFNAFWQYESVAIVLFFPALFLLFKKNRKLFYFLFLSFALFFLCLNPPLINSARPRYLATMMPIIILPAAWLAAEIYRHLRKKNFLLAFLFVVLVFSPVLFLSMRNDHLLAKNSSNLDLFYWLKNNLKKNDNVFVFGAYMSQELLPNAELIDKIKEYSPAYYSSRFRYLDAVDKVAWNNGFGVYSQGFVCKWPKEQIERLKFKYVVLAENSDMGIDLKNFMICGLVPIDLSQLTPVFVRDTSPYFRYSILESYVVENNLRAASYLPLYNIKQFGPRIRVYMVNQ